MESNKHRKVKVIKCLKEYPSRDAFFNFLHILRLKYQTWPAIKVALEGIRHWVNLTAFSMGASLAWSSPATSKLNITTSMSPKQEAGVVSLLFFGAIFGTSLSKFFMVKLGRKGALLLSGIPNIIGFLCLTAGHNFVIIYIGRFFNGFAVGIILSVSPVYLHEMSDVAHRKLLNATIIISTNLGCLFVYVLSLFFKLKLLSIINVIFPLAFVVIFGIMSPDTPHYYISRGRIHEAWDSLKALRAGGDESINNELVLIQKEVVESFSNINNFFDFIRNERFRKKLWVALGLILCNQLIGVTTIFCYMESIFEGFKPQLSPSVCVIIMGIVQLLGSIFGLFVIPKCHKRLLLLVSAFHLSFTLIAITTYLCLKQYEREAILYKMFPIISVSYLVWIYSSLFTPCVSVITKEIFPSYANSVAIRVEAVFTLG
nr:facilitated trehalose transporter Tret1-like [Onthophagus taurus]